MYRFGNYLIDAADGIQDTMLYAYQHFIVLKLEYITFSDTYANMEHHIIEFVRWQRMETMNLVDHFRNIELDIHSLGLSEQGKEILQKWERTRMPPIEWRLNDKEKLRKLGLLE